jgi:hypothetical protein
LKRAVIKFLDFWIIGNEKEERKAYFGKRAVL